MSSRLQREQLQWGLTKFPLVRISVRELDVKTCDLDILVQNPSFSKKGERAPEQRP